MYEVHPNLADQWVLYYTGDGKDAVIACFNERDDAEYARLAFEKKRERRWAGMARDHVHAEV